MKKFIAATLAVSAIVLSSCSTGPSFNTDDPMSKQFADMKIPSKEANLVEEGDFSELAENVCFNRYIGRSHEMLLNDLEELDTKGVWSEENREDVLAISYANLCPESAPEKK